ncbi:MAG: ATPase, T2SS/T4P/T4SS family, partial [Planctomycetales bacterium]
SELRQLASLGMLSQQYNELVSWVNSPTGLILATGPTGSGKTTTLYACLQYLNNGRRKINTIEDPIEYSLEGIRQSQVNDKIGVDFPELLRGVLRQAPDVIMIGEIRDQLTAHTAVRAANSGHLVFATLHAPTAAGAIQSMQSLGVNLHFLATALIGSVSHRLMRDLCVHCRQEVDLSIAPNTFDEVKKWLKKDEGEVMHAPGVCDASCGQELNRNGEGYTGRTGCYETLHVTREIRKLISAGRPAKEIEDQAVKEGMLPFRLAALLKVAESRTPIEEVMRVVPMEQLGLE